MSARTYRVLVPCDWCADDTATVYDPACAYCDGTGWAHQDLDAEDIVGLAEPVALRVLAALSDRDRDRVLCESITVIVDGRLEQAVAIDCPDCDGRGVGSWPGDAWYESHDEECEACGGRGEVRDPALYRVAAGAEVAA